MTDSRSRQTAAPGVRVPALVDEYPEVVEAESDGLEAGADEGVEAGEVESLAALQLDVEGAHAGATAPDGAAGEQREVQAPQHGGRHSEQQRQDAVTPQLGDPEHLHGQWRKAERGSEGRGTTELRIQRHHEPRRGASTYTSTLRRNAHTQRGTHTNTHTQRNTHTHTHRGTHTHTHTHTGAGAHT